MNMNTECYICGARTEVFVAQDSYIFNKCSECGLFFVDPMPSDKELAKVYSPSSNYQSNKIKKDYKIETNFKYIKIFDELKKYTKPKQKIFDVGASDGEFLYYAQKNGLDVFGVEPNKTTADIANKNNLNVEVGFLSACSFEKNSFDVIRLGDVLEHSNSPKKLVDECSSFLKKGGLLIISIPNMDSYWVRATYNLKIIFMLPWSVLEAPHHLLYFSKKNLDLFMKSSGYSLVTTWYHRPPTLKYELGNTHLYGKFKRDKSVVNFIKFISGFSLYSFIYFIDFILTPFKSKDYGMLSIYRKDA